jgi:hypothetical protein
MDTVDRALRRSERRRAVLDIVKVTGPTSAARMAKGKSALAPYPAIDSLREVRGGDFLLSAVACNFSGVVTLDTGVRESLNIKDAFCPKP